MAERFYYSSPVTAPSSVARLHAVISAQKGRWSVKLASSDFRSIVGLPWVV